MPGQRVPGGVYPPQAACHPLYAGTPIQSQPAQPPEPLRTLKDVVRGLGGRLQPTPDLFPVGIEEEIPDLEIDQ